jgi:hypothetical protein
VFAVKTNQARNLNEFLSEGRRNDESDINFQFLISDGTKNTLDDFLNDEHVNKPQV